MHLHSIVFPHDMIPHRPKRLAKESMASRVTFHCVSLSKFVYSLACSLSFIFIVVRKHSDKSN